MNETELSEKIQAKYKYLGPSYIPRTRHFDNNGHAQYTNRLFLEQSPYLLQHAHNPVNWYPWGEEAFRKAQTDHKPILLSVGYSTCHWCHVMEEESFEDNEIAAYINQHYVPVKVDREERPDIDSLYMKAVQALTRQGGWPMTVWLTPEGEPFYGGTYFPPRDGDRGAPFGFLTVLMKLSELFESSRDKLKQRASNLTKLLQEQQHTTAQHVPTSEVLERAFGFYREHFDATYGGLNGAPKFPSSLPIRFLLRYAKDNDNNEALQMAQLTLEKMALGGIYDQIGGGFHRYSTDEMWHTPHFEKMLYDNALLVKSYLQGYQLTKEPLYEKIVCETLDYIAREMTNSNGGFYSATDADSLTENGEKKEGYYFTWSEEEIDALFAPKKRDLVKTYYGITPPIGNLLEGRYILHQPKPLDAMAEQLKLSTKQLDELISKAKNKLFNARQARARPLRDDKIITSWNALMISAFAQAGLTLGREDYSKPAIKAAEFLFDKLWDGQHLYRCYLNQRSASVGFLDDYAFLLAGLLDLFQVTTDLKWFQWALELDEILQQRFEDQEHGGYYLVDQEHTSLFTREMPAYDGAEPCGNSVMVSNLLRLNALTLNDRYRQRASKALSRFGERLKQSPAILSEMLEPLMMYHSGQHQLVIISSYKHLTDDPIYHELRNKYLNYDCVLMVCADQLNQEWQRLIPLLKDKQILEEQTTIYQCKSGSCELPTHQFITAH